MPPWNLSVIVPVLNEAAGIGGLLQDLQALRNCGHEVILVDGGSQDGTAAVAEGRCDLFLHARRGRAAQMNQGAAHATGDALWFVHADSRLPAGADDLIAQALGRAPWGWFHVRLSGRRRMLRMVEWSMNRRSRWTGIATGDQGMFLTCELFRRAGGFPEVPLMEDVRMSTRLKNLAAPAVVATPLVTSSRRWEHRGIGRTIALMWSLRLAHALGMAPRRLARWYGDGGP